MFRRPSLLAVFVALAVSLAAAPPLSAAPGDPEVVGVLTPAEVAAIVAVGAEADARWNARDADGLAGLYTPDGDLMLVDQDVIARGRDAVRDYFRGSLGRTPAALVHTTDVRRLIVLAPGVVQADTHVAVDARPPGGPASRVRDFYTMTVVARVDGEWKIRIVRAHVLAAPAAGR